MSVIDYSALVRYSWPRINWPQMSEVLREHEIAEHDIARLIAWACALDDPHEDIGLHFAVVQIGSMFDRAYGSRGLHKHGPQPYPTWEMSVSNYHVLMVRAGQWWRDPDTGTDIRHTERRGASIADSLMRAGIKNRESTWTYSTPTQWRKPEPQA